MSTTLFTNISLSTPCHDSYHGTALLRRDRASIFVLFNVKWEQMYAERVLPHDIEAEEAVIGALLIDGSAIHEIASKLSPDDFYRERNRWCYEAALALS
ncbi:uncharacterized protein METZ01_LOCUS452624, partial [marine metagenome]